MAGRLARVLCATVLAALFARPVASSLATMLPVPGTAPVVAGDDVAVIDGRTLRVEGRVLRLDGVAVSQAAGGTAALHLAALVRAKRVACQLDGGRTGGDPTARCQAGGTDLNTALVAGGWAEAQTDAPGPKQTDTAARPQHLGLWVRR